MRYLERVKKTGAYRFRRGIPAHLRPYFPGRGAFWREDLHTKIESEARPRCLEVAAKVEKLFQQAQARFNAGQGQSPTSAEPLPVSGLVRLVEEWKRRERSRRAQMALARPVALGWSEFLHESDLAGLTQTRPRPRPEEGAFDPFAARIEAEEDGARFMARMEGAEVYIDTAIRSLTQANGYLIDSQHPSHAVLSDLLHKAWVEVLRSEERWRANDFADLPLEEEATPALPPTASPATSPQPVLADNPLFSTALEDWVRLSKPSDRTQTEARTALRLFTELHGDLPIRSIDKVHTRKFRDALAQLPINLTAKQKAVPLPVLLNEVTGTLRAPQTVNKTLNLLSGVLSRAEKEGYFDHMLWANPFSVHLEVDDDDEESYEPLSNTDLKALFGSPVFAEGARPKQGRGDTAFWAPLLILFHGTRRQDITQLFVRDVGIDADTKVHFIDINRDDGKKVKNTDSVRRIPLHPTIIEMGFLDWLATRQQKVGADASLWPGFEDRQKLDGRINRWGKWFGAYLVEVGIDDPMKKLHSLRGTFKRCGKDCDVPDPVLDRICGHAFSSVGGKYGRKKNERGQWDGGYSLEKLEREIAKVRFAGQDSLRPFAKAPPIQRG